MNIQSSPFTTSYARSQAVAMAQPAEAPSASALSTAERQALDREFPASPSLALRLYGPQRGATEAAQPVGSRLDLRG